MSDIKRRSRRYFQVGGRKIQITSCLESSIRQRFSETVASRSNTSLLLTTAGYKRFSLQISEDGCNMLHCQILNKQPKLRADADMGLCGTAFNVNHVL